MSGLHGALDEYLALRRAVGFKLIAAGTLLPGFVAYLDSVGAETITIETALAWALRTSNPARASTRLAVVRGFARYLQALDPRTEVPEPRLLVAARGRPIPYLYSEGEITSLMAAARALAPSLWAATCETVIGLLWATGMRIGEVLRLERSDVRWDESVLVVRLAKFDKSRYVPLAASTLCALAAYDEQRRRQRLCPDPPSFFVSIAGGRLNYLGIHREFAGLLSKTGIPTIHRARRPRLHDLRHSFAVRTLLGWYRAGEDVQALLPRLSTYLGHVDPTSTYWYLSAAPELLAMAATRLESLEGRPS